MIYYQFEQYLKNILYMEKVLIKFSYTLGAYKHSKLKYDLYSFHSLFDLLYISFLKTVPHSFISTRNKIRITKMIVDTNTSKKRIEMFGKLFSYYLEANIAITYVLLKFICTDLSRDVFFPTPFLSLL